MNTTIFVIYDTAEMRPFEIHSNVINAVVQKNKFNKIVDYERFIVESIYITKQYQLTTILNQCYGSEYIKWNHE